MQKHLSPDSVRWSQSDVEIKCAGSTIGGAPISFIAGTSSMHCIGRFQGGVSSGSQGAELIVPSQHRSFAPEQPQIPR
jgi:hypothetical protein